MNNNNTNNDNKSNDNNNKYIQGLMKALITNLLSDLQILKWRIQYDTTNFEKIRIFWDSSNDKKVKKKKLVSAIV